jgi:16S rRNA (guanine527-N7)-methyltransferase
MDNWYKEIKTQFSEHQCDQLEQYYTLLVEWNQKMNLTSLTERQDVFIKHFLDSVQICQLPAWEKIKNEQGTVVDIGTGAGFPGIPLAIRHPEVKFTLCDALAKRISFLQTVVELLGLDNVELVHSRAEDLAQDSKYRQQFHGCVSRAVARLNILLEFMCPLVQVGGISFAYKGPLVKDELPDGIRAAKILGGRILDTSYLKLPNEAGERNIVLVEQVAVTSKKYPRKAGTPQRKPL